MKVKFNQSALSKLESDISRKLEMANRKVLSRIPGKSAAEVETIARREFSAIGVNLNADGIRKYVEASRP